MTSDSNKVWSWVSLNSGQFADFKLIDKEKSNDG
jgi:hypothetical protein